MATYVQTCLILQDHPTAEEISTAATYTGISTVYSEEIPAAYVGLVTVEDLPATVTETTVTEVVSMELIDPDDGVTVLYAWDEEQTISHEVVVATHVDVGV